MGIIEDISAGIVRIEAKLDALGGTVPPPPPPPTPVDCVLSAWSAWSAWAPSADGQTENRTRTRVVVTPPANGGAACGPLTETEVRNVAPPPPPPPPPPPIDPSGNPPLPTDTKGWTITLAPSPAPGKGPPMTGGLGSAMKHVRKVYSAGDKRHWMFGGDYWNPFRSYDSGAHITQAHDVSSGVWEIIHTFGSPGEVTPTGNDEVGVDYDPKRDGFWLVCGYQWNTANEAPGPDVSATRLHNVILFLDRKTQKWVQPFPEPVPFLAYDGSPGRAAYDEQRDRMVAWRYDSIWWLDCATGAKSWKSMMVPGINFFPDKGIHFRDGRWVYCFGNAKDPADGIVKGVLCRANLDTYAAELFTWLPAGVSGGGIDFPLIAHTRQALFWGPKPALGSWLINIDTKAITEGPPNPLTLLGNPFLPLGCFYDPPTGKVVLGWSVFDTTNEEKPYRCWHYTPPTTEQPPAPPGGL